MTPTPCSPLEAKIEVLARNYGVVSLEIIDGATHGFDALSVVLQIPNGGFVIMTSKDACIPLRLFSQLHEIGHIALGYLYKIPQESHDKAIETEINLWALDRLRALISAAFYATLREKLQIDEHSAFALIAERLMQEIDGITRKRIFMNPDLIHRENDRSLFSFSEFKLYRFNAAGHQLLAEIAASPLYDDFCQKAEALGFSQDDVEEFVSSCLDADLIRLSDAA